MNAAGRLLRALPYGVLGAAAAWLYGVASAIEYHHRPGTLGPDIWPKAILALLIGVCALQILKVIVFGRAESGGMIDDIVQETAQDGRDRGADAAAPAESHPWMLAGGMALTAAYIASIRTLGFTVATVIYLAAFIALGGYRRWGVIAAVSGIGTVLLVFFFMKVVYVSLPIGVEPFSHVTLGLMQLLGIR